jgi:hypothetical protein
MEMGKPTLYRQASPSQCGELFRRCSLPNVKMNSVWLSGGQKNLISDGTSRPDLAVFNREIATDYGYGKISGIDKVYKNYKGSSRGGSCSPIDEINILIKRSLHQICLALQETQGCCGSGSSASSGSRSVSQLPLHQIGLSSDGEQCRECDPRVRSRDVYNDPFRSQENWKGFLCGFLLFVIGLWLGNGSWERCIDNNVGWRDWPVVVICLGCACIGGGLMAFGHLWPPKQACTDDSQDKKEEDHSFLLNSNRKKPEETGTDETVP